MNIDLPKVGLAGRFRVVVSEDPEMENVTYDHEFDNLITNVGMNRIGAVNTNQSGTGGLSSFNSLCGRFVVGSGNAVPTFEDVALQNPVAYASSQASEVSSSSSFSRGWYEITVSHQFEQGVAQGNISEVGIQQTSTSGPLWSRALILDGLGNPTTIVVRDTDFLTCYYTLRVMIPQDDVTYTINVDYGDEGQVPTQVTLRPLNTENAGHGGWLLQTSATSSTPSDLQFYTGGLATPQSSNPLGSLVGSLRGGTVQPYVNDTFTKWVVQSAGLSELNSSELRTANVRCLMGCWQMEFNPPLVKNNTHTMDLAFGYSWARA